MEEGRKGVRGVRRQGVEVREEEKKEERGEIRGF